MKRNLGVYFITALVALNILLWLLLPRRTWMRTRTSMPPAGQQVAEMISSSAMILWACGIFLSNKPRFLEPYFGGLDRMYITHKNINILALLLIVVHLIIVPTSETGGPGVWIGWVTFPAMLIMVLLTVSPRVPLISNLARLSYDRWRNLHRYMGLLYIVGATHMLMTEPLILHTPVVFAYVESIIALGVLAYLYRQFLWERLKRRAPFAVKEVRKLNGTVAQVTLSRRPGRSPTGPDNSYTCISMPTRRCASRIRSPSARRRTSRTCGCRSSPAATGRSTCTRSCRRARGPSSTGHMGSSTTRRAAGSSCGSLRASA
jgi:predicted ferric reductase